MTVTDFLKRSCLGAALVALLAVTGPATAIGKERESAFVAGTVPEALREGARLEQRRYWLDAITHYQKALEKWPDDENLEYGIRRSRIQFGVDRRYTDRSFRQTLLGKSRRSALILLDEVLAQVRSNYVESITSRRFVAHGTESLYFALKNDRFLRAHLENADPGRIKRFRQMLVTSYWNRQIAHRVAARDVVSEVCDRARQDLGLSPGAVVLEYVFGGFNALDDYSDFLTPDKYADLNSSISGEIVGLGIEMEMETGRGVHLLNVFPDSPAEEGGLGAGDFIVRIDGRDCRHMSLDDAARLLRGVKGSRVVLEYRTRDDDRMRRGTFSRRHVQVKSVPEAFMLDGHEGIGYIKMTGFQSSTEEELDAALLKLEAQGMRALVWDLRGNPGGLLDVAANVVDRFIDNGVLVSTRGRTREQNQTFTAQSFNTRKYPLALLVDGDSASASEIVAGAIRDHSRGSIIGERTYGKWSVQTILRLRDGTGLRLTTARFYSPPGRTFGDVGVKPNFTVADIDQPSIPDVELLDAPPDGSTTGRRSSHYRGNRAEPAVRKAMEILRKRLSRR